MRTANTVFLIGILMKDPRFGTTNRGGRWATGLLKTERLKKEGEKIEAFHVVAAYAELADYLAQAKAGEQLCIEGELENSSFVDKDGNHITRVQVKCNAVMRGLFESAPPQEEMN